MGEHRTQRDRRVREHVGAATRAVVAFGESALSLAFVTELAGESAAAEEDDEQREPAEPAEHDHQQPREHARQHPGDRGRIERVGERPEASRDGERERDAHWRGRRFERGQQPEQ